MGPLIRGRRAFHFLVAFLVAGPWPSLLSLADAPVISIHARLDEPRHLHSADSSARNQRGGYHASAVGQNDATSEEDHVSFEIPGPAAWPEIRPAAPLRGFEVPPRELRPRASQSLERHVPLRC